MRWLVGWSSAAPAGGRVAPGSLQPVGAQLLWSDPDPLWAVGDWRPDEVRVIQADPATGSRSSAAAAPPTRSCGVGLFAARGGAFAI